jgi:hypothetical protein
LHGVVKFLLADCAVLGKGRIALYIQLRLELRGFGPVDFGLSGVYIGFRLRKLGDGDIDLGICLVDNCLEGSRVDLEEKVSHFDQGSFSIILRHQISGDLRMDLRIDKPDRCSDPLRVHGHILPDGRPDCDLGQARRRGLPETTTKA